MLVKTVNNLVKNQIEIIEEIKKYTKSLKPVQKNEHGKVANYFYQDIIICPKIQKMIVINDDKGKQYNSDVQ